MTNRHAQRGFGAIAAIIVLVFLAALAAAMTRLGVSQHTSSAQDVLSARAWQAARAGTEWGLYQALKNDSCMAAATTLDLSAATGFWVSVTCAVNSYNEGETAAGAAQIVNVYTIGAVACNVSSGCPASGSQVAAPDYVERARQVIATN